MTAEEEAALYTGMRQGELLNLTWGQVDLLGWTFDFPPTKRGNKRLVPIAEPLYYILVWLRDAQARAGGHGPDGRVFLREDGHPWSKWGAQYQFNKAIEAAKIPPIRFHDLRHSCSSRLKRQGVHEMDIQQLLGHKSLQTTHGYIHIRTEELRRAVNLLPSTNVAHENAVKESLSSNYK